MSDFENKFCFVWKIKNFSMLPHQFGEFFKSPSFDIDMFKNAQLRIQLYPRGHTKRDYLGMFLHFRPTDLDLNLYLKISVESTDSKVRKLYEHRLDPFHGSGLGLESFMLLTELYEKQNIYLPQDTLTIRCEVKPVHESLILKPRSPFYKRITCIRVQRRCLMWPIKWGKEHTTLVTGHHKGSPSLMLQLVFTENENVKIFITQTRISSHTQQLFVKCKLTVCSSLKDSKNSKTSCHLFKNYASDVWRFPSFLTASMWNNTKHVNVDETLLLRCEFAFSFKDDVHHNDDTYEPLSFKTRSITSELNTSFKNMSGELSDVELKAGGTTFPYYKAVLGARSSVFLAMFKNDMTEKSSNVVEINDIEPETLQRMLNYMMSDVFQEDLSNNEMCKLYHVADKYDVVSLKSRCSIALASTVSLLNVCNLLDLADHHLDSFLMTAACDFICSHKTEFFHSDQWKNFMEENPKLSCKVMFKMMSRNQFEQDD